MILSLQGLAKRYRRNADFALTDFCLELAAEQVLCLVGESGSGKTTVLRLIAGFDLPDAGSIAIGGRTVVDAHTFLPPEKRGLGMVFQEHALFPHLSVARNIAFGLRGWSRGERRARVAELLQLMAMPGYEKRYPHELSGGQRQRIALARALAPRPPLVLFDEPFCSLDAQLKKQMLGELRETLRQTGTTAVCVTHDAEDAFELADRLAVLRDGQLVQQGTVRELYERPVDRYVADFFGKTNLLRAHPAGPEQLQTDLGPIRLHNGAAHRNRDEAGERLLLLRPEDFTLVPEDQGACARVEAARFLGHCQELRVRVTRPGDCELTLYAPVEPPIAPGDRVHLRPNAQRAQLIPAPEPSAE